MEKVKSCLNCIEENKMKLDVRGILIGVIICLAVSILTSKFFLILLNIVLLVFIIYKSKRRK